MMTLLAFYRTLRVVSVMALGCMTLSTTALEKVAVETTHHNQAQNQQAHSNKAEKNQALPASGNWFQYGFKPMGTQAYVEVWAVNEQQAQQAFAKVEAEFSRVNALMSPWVEQSELSLLNREAAKQPVTVSREMYQLLKRAAAVSELSQGAFDVTFASVGFQFDYRAHKKPDAQTLASQKQWINYRYVELLPNNQVALRQAWRKSRFRWHRQRLHRGALGANFSEHGHSPCVSQRRW